MKACNKMYVVIMVMVSALFIQPEISFSFGDMEARRCCHDCDFFNPSAPCEDGGYIISTGTMIKCMCYDCKKRVDWCLDVPNPRKRSLRRIQKDNSSLTCGQNALCGTLKDGNFDWIYGQVGIYMDYSGRKVFIPLYVKEAAFSDDGYVIPYMIPKWNGKVLWMNISEDVPPLFIQPLYLDDDPTRPGYMQMVSTAMGYKKKDADYSLYPSGSAIMYMYIDLDADFRVTEYTIDVYDQNGDISEERVKLDIGDEVQTMYSADNQDDTYPLWNQLTLEGSAVVTQLPPMPEMFVYVGYIPGRDIVCTNCSTVNLDLSLQELYFRVAGYTVDPETETEKPTYSQLQPLGQVKDNVCAQYPNLTTKEPTLTDVVEGLKILASLAPQNFCFRDVNADNKFGMKEVIWMLQKIAGLRISSALIYNGVASDADSASSLEAIAKKAGYQTEFFTDPKLITEKLKTANLLIFGGSEDDLNPLMNLFNAETVQAVKDFINNGGVYLGVCGGAFIASDGWEDPDGFVKALGFTQIETDSYLIDPAPVVIKVKWKKGEVFSERAVYYQFGPKFLPASENPVQVIANYDDNTIAACLVNSGKGKLILVGPHPEADETWIDDTVKNFGDWTPTLDLSDELMSLAIGK